VLIGAVGAGDAAGPTTSLYSNSFWAKLIKFRKIWLLQIWAKLERNLGKIG